MARIMVISIVAVLAMGLDAPAQITFQYQNWDIGLSSGINLSDGAGAATLANGLQAEDIQNMTIGGPGMLGFSTPGATQEFAVAASQVGSATTGGLTVLPTWGSDASENSVPVTGLTFNSQTNPVLPASGTFSFGGLGVLTPDWGAASNGFPIP